MGSQRILLVEDDELLQKLYLDLLKGENYYVETAGDGITAFDKIKQGNWDLVLLDIMLPDFNGVEVIKKISADKGAKSNKKVIFLTNLDTGSEINDVKKMGFDFVVKSNLTPDQFISKVKSYL